MLKYILMFTRLKYTSNIKNLPEMTSKSRVSLQLVDNTYSQVNYVDSLVGAFQSV